MAYLVNGNDIFKAARENHYAVGAYNTNNLEWTRALLRGAKETRTPLLIQVSTGAAKYMGGYKTVKDLVLNEMDNMDIDVPVILNLDHGDFESAKECIALGYSSVMFDGHNLPTDENLAKTKEIVKLAHERGISVEAEIGKIGENQGADGGELASVEDAKTFVAARVDKLACGIGNIHGVYPEGWTGLNFDRLKEIAEAVPNEPLVLHGGSGIPQEDIPNMFQRFSQGTSKKRSTGTGLGLYLSRQIIESHGGKIWLESSLNKGSEFSFILTDTVVGGIEEKEGSLV